MKIQSKFFLILVGLAALVLFPLLVPNPYYIHLVETILIYAILLFGLDIVVGYTGQVSLGHAGLFGVGSYTAGALFFKLGVPFFLAVPAAIGVTALFGAILALPALRVTGPYLAMVTLATLKGWHGWLALKLRELEAGLPATGEAAPLGMGSRIEIADLKERIRKLEAIAAGVDL